VLQQQDNGETTYPRHCHKQQLRVDNRNGNGGNEEMAHHPHPASQATARGAVYTWNDNKQQQQNSGTMNDDWEATRMGETKWKGARDVNNISWATGIFFFSFHFHFTNKCCRY
jgi:hypothetical protein